MGKKNQKGPCLLFKYSFLRKYFASGQITHEVVVGYMTPYIRYWKSFYGHDRSPWVLTFDPLVSYILYSGCLNGKVCKWDIRVRVCVCRVEPLYNGQLQSNL